MVLGNQARESEDMIGETNSSFIWNTKTQHTCNYRICSCFECNLLQIRELNLGQTCQSAPSHRKYYSVFLIASKQNKTKCRRGVTFLEQYLLVFVFQLYGEDAKSCFMITCCTFFSLHQQQLVPPSCHFWRVHF